MKTCILFPGQGAQSIGMGKDLYDGFASVRTLFEEASDASKIDLAALIFSGTEDDLKQTRNTQVALALVDTAAALCLRERGVVASGAAGFSLGEWAAMTEAGVVPFPEMIRLVAENDIPDSGKLNHGAPGETGTLISRLEALEKAEEIMRTAEEERRSILDHPLPFTWYTKEPPRVDGLLVCAEDGVWKRTRRWDAKEESWYLEGPKPRFKTAFCIWKSWKRWMIIEE